MGKWINKIESFQMTFASVFLVVFVICVILQILTRHAPFVSFQWTEEAARYSFIWSVFMGASVMVRRKKHFAMTSLIEKLPVSITKAINILNEVLIMFFGLAMMFYGYLLTLSFWGWSLNTLPLFDQQYTWAVIPVAGITISIYSLSNILDIWREPQVKVDSKEAERYNISGTIGEVVRK